MGKQNGSAVGNWQNLHGGGWGIWGGHIHRRTHNGANSTDECIARPFVRGALQGGTTGGHYSWYFHRPTINFNWECFFFLFFFQSPRSGQ